MANFGAKLASAANTFNAYWWREINANFSKPLNNHNARTKLKFKSIGITIG